MAAVHGGSTTRWETMMKRTTLAAVRDDDEADGAGCHVCGLSHDIADEVQSVKVGEKRAYSAVPRFGDDNDADGADGRTRT